MILRPRSHALLALLALPACSLSPTTPATAHTPPATPPPAAPPEATAKTKGVVHPNIVFVLADDLALWEMPQLSSITDLFKDAGTTFDHAFVSVSLCCPSRATTLRGQYAHNTGIFTNWAPLGGYGVFRDKGRENATVATWLQAEGYRTGLFGKYMNGYPGSDAPTVIPKGWDDWVVPAKGDAYSSYNYTLNDNGQLVEHGAAEADHITDVIAQQAVDFIRESSAKHKPFFAYVAPYAPHSPATAPPRYLGEFTGVTAPRTPSFNEADMSDKAPWSNALGLMPDVAIEHLDRAARNRLQAMLGVRDLLTGVVKALDDTGHAEDTILVFASDNGYHLGQHRLKGGKDTHFDEDLRVPLYVRGPGVPKGAHQAAMVVNTDLAPSFLSMAGVATPSLCDGRSWWPLLQGETPTWRRGVLLEHAASVDTVAAAAASSADPGTLEPDDEVESRPAPMPTTAPGGQGAHGAHGGGGHAGGGHGGGSMGASGPHLPPFVGVRSEGYAYVRFEDGSKELYDLAADPYELTNIVAQAKPTMITSLDAWVDAMRKCEGADCRRLEEANPIGP